MLRGLRWPLLVGLLLILGWAMPTSVVAPANTATTSAERISDDQDLGNLPSLALEATVAEAEAEEEPVESSSNHGSPTTPGWTPAALVAATLAAAGVYLPCRCAELSPRLARGPPAPRLA